MSAQHGFAHANPKYTTTKDEKDDQANYAQYDAHNGAIRVQGQLLMQAVDLVKATQHRDYDRGDLFRGFNFDVISGDKIGLLGINGAGKSTLMKVIAGLELGYQGDLKKCVDDLQIGYLSQEPKFDESRTVFDNVKDGLGKIIEYRKRFDQILEEMGDPFCNLDALADEQSQINAMLDYLDGWDVDDRVYEVIRMLKCPEPGRSMHNLSGGEKRRVALARLLLSHPDILLLDEPTNHLDIDSVLWLEKFIQDFTGTAMMVTHDRIFLENSCDSIWELAHGHLHCFYGAYSEWLAERLRIQENFENHNERVSKQIEREIELLKKKGTRNQARKNRVSELNEQLIKHSPFGDRYDPRMKIPAGPDLRTDKTILNFVDVEYRWPDNNEVQFANVSFSVDKESIIGLVGPNGAGKTTLLRLIAGELNPTKGVIEKGSSLKLGFITQDRQDLSDNNTVRQEIGGISERVYLSANRYVNVDRYCGWFDFREDGLEKYVKHLSGGERNRVHLAKSLKDGFNFLLLDEPSNDLDMESLRRLEACLEKFKGVAIISSHDRYFLERVCTHVLTIDEKGVVTFYDESYEKYEEEKALKQKMKLRNCGFDKSKYLTSKKKKQEHKDRIQKKRQMVVDRHEALEGQKEYLAAAKEESERKRSEAKLNTRMNNNRDKFKKRIQDRNELGKMGQSLNQVGNNGVNKANNENGGKRSEENVA